MVNQMWECLSISCTELHVVLQQPPVTLFRFQTFSNQPRHFGQCSPPAAANAQCTYRIKSKSNFFADWKKTLFNYLVAMLTVLNI